MVITNIQILPAKAYEPILTWQTVSFSRSLSEPFKKIRVDFELKDMEDMQVSLEKLTIYLNGREISIPSDKISGIVSPYLDRVFVYEPLKVKTDWIVYLDISYPSGNKKESVLRIGINSQGKIAEISNIGHLGQ